MEACVGDVWYACTGLLHVGGNERGESEPRYVRLGKLGLRIDQCLNSLYQLNCKGVLCGYCKNSIRPPVFFRLEQKKRTYMNDDRRKWMEPSQRVFTLIEISP